jgi:two-component system, chemotaxis family, CheB/CheR fusion protein
MVSKNELLTRLNSDLRNLLDSTEIATIFLDDDLRIKSFTAGMTDIFHLRDADRGRPVTDITTLLSYPDLQKDAKKVMRSLTVIEKEVSLADEGMSFLMRIRPYRTVEKVIDGVVITFVDITEREKAARALRVSEQRLAAIVDQATVGVAENDLNGRFVLVNSRYCEIVGRSAEELRGLRMQDITHPEDWPRNLESLRHLNGEGKSFEIEKRYVRPDGSIVWAHSNVAAVTGSDGRPQHAVVVWLDITERKRADETPAAYASRAESPRQKHARDRAVRGHAGASQYPGHGAGPRAVRFTPNGLVKGARHSDARELGGRAPSCSPLATELPVFRRCFKMFRFLGSHSSRATWK